MDKQTPFHLTITKTIKSDVIKNIAEACVVAKEKPHLEDLTF